MVTSDLTCYEHLRDVDHNAFWHESRPFTTGLIAFIALSTALEAKIGHVLPLEVLTRVAHTWPSASMGVLRAVS